MSASVGGKVMQCDSCKKKSDAKSPLTRACDIDLYGPNWPRYLKPVKHSLCRFPKQNRCLSCLTIFRIHSARGRC